MDKIRLGIIGCGGMASGSHVRGIKALSDSMTVTATCDIELERAQKVADLLGADFYTADYRQLLDHVDAVLIALPHDLHHEAGIVFLNAGKHVLMEKPLANTEQECLELIEASERNGAVLMTAYPVRFWPVIRKMKELIDNKTYGDVFQMSIWTEQFTKYPPGHWALSAKRLGGGQFFSHGCHYVDLLLWFLGKPVTGIHIGTNLGTPWMEKEGTSNAVIHFESGAIGYHMGTWGARGTRLGYSIHIHCTEGMLEYNKADNKLYLHSRIREEQANQDTTSHLQVLMEESDLSKQTQFEIQHFITCIQNGTRPLTDGYSSLEGLRVIWKLYDAEQNGVMADLRGISL